MAVIFRIALLAFNAMACGHLIDKYCRGHPNEWTLPVAVFNGFCALIIAVVIATRSDEA